jgi:DNA-binding NtrC family response regulator
VGPRVDREPEVLVFDGLPFVIRSAASRKLLSMVQRVARYPTAVLIVGETGTGKELIARAIHHFSLRCTKPWVDVNCAALPEHLIESELFGHEKGAFSGADSMKAGFFEMAHQGTLFLDEIGDLDPRMQVKLLRVLDGAPYYRLGGTRKVAMDVRIVAATNRDLDEGVRAGTFRNDLFHRLCQIQLIVPPLRERPEDIEGIAAQVLHGLNPRARISADAMEYLRQYSWPGNVRELKNVVTRLAIMREDPEAEIQPSDLPANITGLAGTAAQAEVPVGDLDNMERLMIQQALATCGGDYAAAAEQLGISRRTLSRKLKTYKMEEAQPKYPTLGLLSLEQHRYFRATAQLRVDLKSSHGHTLNTTSTNISTTGMGVQGIVEPFKFPGVLDVSLFIHESQPPVTAKGRITWADAQGRAGIRFLSLEAASKHHLERWLAEKLQQEGWSRMS